MCSCCQTIIYSRQEGSSLNHKKEYCGDGVKQVFKADEVLPWPQPQGIFTASKTFHLQAFYMMVQDIYEQYCIPGAKSPPITSMEAMAFAKLLVSRTHTFNNGVIGFRLFADYELDAKTLAGYIFHPKDSSDGWL